MSDSWLHYCNTDLEKWHMVAGDALQEDIVLKTQEEQGKEPQQKLMKYTDPAEGHCMGGSQMRQRIGDTSCCSEEQVHFFDVPGLTPRLYLSSDWQNEWKW